MGTTNLKIIGWILMLLAGIGCLIYVGYRSLTETFDERQMQVITIIIVGLSMEISASIVGIRHERRKIA